MSEHEESAGSDPTIPGEHAAWSGPAEPDSGQPGSSPHSAPGRGQRAAKIAGAVTSRTAGWMVAAALAGSLTTLLLDNGTAQPTASQVVVRDAGRMAPGPGPSTRVLYPGPGGPQAAGRSSWVLGPAAPGPAWLSCAFPVPGGRPFAPGKIGSVRIHRAWQVIIVGPGRRHVQIKTGSVPAPKAIRLARPGCPMIPLRCQAALHVIIKRHGRLVIVGPRPGRLPRRIGVRAPAGKRISVVLPGRSFTSFTGPRCAPVPAHGG